MAIKIVGTTVIDDTRQLQNIASLDATTIATINANVPQGDITGVTAGAGLTGGGTSGAVTVSHADTSSQASLTALTGANVVSDIDVDTYGHVTLLATRAMTAADIGAITGNQTITLSGDLSGSGTTSINAQIAANVVGANELNVTGNGTTSQYLRSDGDGSFTWATPPDTNTTYSAGSGLTLSTTTFSVNSDLKGIVSEIGASSNDYLAFQEGNIRFWLSGNEEFRMEADGDFHADGDIIAFSTAVSDERLKENITVVEDALSKVNQLRGVEFTYKADGKRSAGVIAQEVEKVLPQAVKEKKLPLMVGDEDNTEYKVVQYDQLHAILIEAIKELSAKVEALESKL